MNGLIRCLQRCNKDITVRPDETQIFVNKKTKCTNYHFQNLFSLLPPRPHLSGSLTHHTGGAEAGAAAVTTRAALDVKPLPGQLPQDEGGQAGDEAGCQAAQAATLSHSSPSAVCLARPTPQGTATDTAVSTIVAQILSPVRFNFSYLLHGSRLGYNYNF